MSAATSPKLERPRPIEALNRLNDIVSRYCESQVLITACQLGVFDQLHAGPATAAQLAVRLNVNADACQRLLSGLAQLDLVQRDNEHFQNSPVGEFLTSSSSASLAGLAGWNIFYPMWGALPDAIREFGPRWQQAHGTTAEQIFANLYKDPQSLRRFAALMSAYSLPQGQILAETFDFSGCNCILDVAGGPGELIIQIGKRHPHIKGIVMDLPPVCEVADEHIAAAGLSDRFRSEFADLLAGPYPAGADVIALSWVLHDWSDETCRKILRNCYDALPSGGALLITESVLNEDLSGTPFAVLMSLHMLVVCEPGAKERSESQYRTLLEETGFHQEALIRLAAPRDLIVATRV